MEVIDDRQRIINNIITITDDCDKIQLANGDIRIEFKDNKYSAKKLAVWNIYLNGKRIKKSDNYIFEYTCVSCHSRQLLSPIALIRKVNKCATTCIECMRHPVLGQTPKTLSYVEKRDAAIKEFNALDDDYKSVYFQNHLTPEEYLRISSNIVGFQNGKITDFENIELADILKLTDLKTLSGRAKLAGNASMSYDLQGGLDVNQAELHSISETGLIQYQPADGKIEASHLGQGGASMAFQVLDNLNFTVFNVRLEHLADNPAEMQGIVKMLGSNPKVLNGYPFEFNIVTTGKLKDLVINTLHHMKPPTDLGKLNQAIKETKAAKALEKEKVSTPRPEDGNTAQEASSEESAEAKAAKTSQEVAQNLDFKVSQATHEQKGVNKPRIAKRAQVIHVRKKVKSRKKIKRVRAVKNFKDKNRKIING